MGLGGASSHQALLDNPKSLVPTVKGGRRPLKADDLKRNTEELLQRFQSFLMEGNRLEMLLADSKLRDILVGWGILIDKFQLLSGQPTQIFGQSEHKSLDELSGALLKEVERRKQAKLGSVEATVVK